MALSKSDALKKYCGLILLLWSLNIFLPVLYAKAIEWQNLPGTKGMFCFHF